MLRWIIMGFLHTLAKTNLWLFFSPTDNSISVLAKHDTFRRQKQEMYFLPIIVTDNGNPPMSSTNTLTIRVCGCSKDGIVQSCNVEAYVLPIGLSMGALIAILACIVLLLGVYKKSDFGWNLKSADSLMNYWAWWVTSFNSPKFYFEWRFPEDCQEHSFYEAKHRKKTFICRHMQTPLK